MSWSARRTDLDLVKVGIVMMKKTLLLCSAAVLGAMFSLSGCGSSACQDYLDEVSACCAKITDNAAKTSCQAIVNAINVDDGDADACQAAADAYTCPL